MACFGYNSFAMEVSAMELKTGTILHGFRVTRVREIPDCAGVLYEMEHEKTGAQLCWMKREDENKTFAIAFKTLPEDDTGVFHILEHSVLNGSDKYPVREPFVELLKSSMQTFLNAFTYPDKTMYPVSSRNDQDFMNLMSVYMDAVFHPAIYHNPNIFYQEGWHYEIRSEEDEPVYKGVVLNEMKGAFASVDETLMDEMNRILFPDNSYRFVSGGDPEHITDLSYEKFLETHGRFYHPSNARIFLDGSLDIDKALAFIDDAYFSTYEKEDFCFDIPVQEAVPAVTKRYEYEVTPGDQTEHRTQIALAKVISRFDDPMKNLAWNLLPTVLVGTNDSKLKKAIIDNGLGEDVELDIIDGVQQPWVILNVRNTDEDKYEEVRQTLRKTAEEILEEGISHEQLSASLNMMEFRYRERHEPAGLMYGQRAMETWLYNGDPAQNLCIGGLFDELRRKTEEGYFEELFREFIMDEEHLACVVAVPSETLLAEKAEKEKARLHQAKESWGDSISEYIERNRILDEWQQTPDSEEAINSLPKLALSDLSEKPAAGIPHQEISIRGVPVLVYPAEASGIVYMTLYFNLAGITKEHLPSLGFYSGLFGALPTKNKTVEEVQQAIRADLGGLTFFLDAHSPAHEYESCVPVFGAACSVLGHNVEKAADLILEILQETVFDKEKILPLLKQENESFRQTLIMSGHSVAMRRIGLHCSAEGVFREYAGGYESARFSKDLEDHYDEKIGSFLEECELYSDILFSPARLTVSVTGEHEDLIDSIIDRLHYTEAQRAKVHYPIEKDAKEAIVIPAAISYSALGMNLHKIEEDYRPQMLVMSHMMTFEYLWTEVRVKGGAYGTGFSANPNGTLSAYSYRDPSPANALKALREAGKYLKENETDDITPMIIGALASTEPLLSPAVAIRIEDTRYFRGITYENRAKARKAILNMTAEDLKNLADLLEKAIANASVCIVGNKETIDSLSSEELEELPAL